MKQKFEAAVDAVVSGDLETLKTLLHDNPSLVAARSSRDHRATLLHYIAANGVEGDRQKTPPNAVEVAQLLIEVGAEVDALAETYGGGKNQTSLNLLLTSAHPARAGLQADLVRTLCSAGAAVNGLEDNGAPLNAAVEFMYPGGFLEHQYSGARQSIEALAGCGARVENIHAATALGYLDHVQRTFENTDGSGGAQKDLARAFVFACMCGRIEIAEFLLGKGVHVNTAYRQNETGLHLAAGCDQLPMVRFLIERGADATCRDDRYGRTPLEWAEHFGADAIGDYLREISA